jgi:hypothetical protein
MMMKKMDFHKHTHRSTTTRAVVNSMPCKSDTLAVGNKVTRDHAALLKSESNSMWRLAEWSEKTTLTPKLEVRSVSSEKSTLDAPTFEWYGINRDSQVPKWFCP